MFVTMGPVFLAPELNPGHQSCYRRAGSLIKGFDGASGASGARRADLCPSFLLLVVAGNNRQPSLPIPGVRGEMSRNGPLVRRHEVLEGGEHLCKAAGYLYESHQH